MPDHRPSWCHVGRTHANAVDSRWINERNVRCAKDTHDRGRLQLVGIGELVNNVDLEVVALEVLVSIFVT